MRKSIPIFYRPEMVATTDSYSPSAAKPQLVIEDWLCGAIQPGDIHSFKPVDKADLYLAHSKDYVDGVLSCNLPNGFYNYDQAVANSLPYTVGSMVAATLHVAQHGGFACSPTSGFHHARYGEGGGFCTFNGLMVAALLARMQGYRVGILDFDAHYGDGTDNILSKNPGHGIKHHTFGAHFPTGNKAIGWTGWLQDAIEDLRDCDVVLYQAGADPYEHDPLGGQMSMTALAHRDELVFGGLKNVAWNLAGGYTRDSDGGISAVLSIHHYTLLAAQQALQQQEPA